MGELPTKAKLRRRGERANLGPQKVLDETCKLLAKRGFSDISFQEIADQLHVSQSTVFHYFKNRDELIYKVLGYVVESNHVHVSQLAKIEDDALTRLGKHLSGNQAWAFAHADQASVILYLYYMGSVRPEFAELYRKILIRGRERIMELLLAAQRERAIRAIAPLDLLAELIHDILLASLVNAVATQAPQLEEKRLQKKWRELISEFLVPADHPASLHPGQASSATRRKVRSAK